MDRCHADCLREALGSSQTVAPTIEKRDNVSVQNSPLTPCGPLSRTRQFSLMQCQAAAPFHMDLNPAVPLANFLPPGGTKAHSLVEVSSTIIPLYDLQSH
jgi:hypothetical protein